MKEEIAELFSGLGIGILGIGLGILLSSYFQSYALLIIFIGILLHGLGMYYLHLRRKSAKEEFTSRNFLYRLCWVILILLFIFFFITVNPWLMFSLILLGVWFVVWLAKPILREEILWTSLLTMPFGLTEPLFVPEYWNPPSLFDLAARTGFDIESLIFSFAIGGIGSVFYEAFFKVRHEKMSRHEKHLKRHRFHLLTLLLPIFVFLILYFSSEMNPIYSASIAMFSGGFAALFCRPDLRKKIWMSGFLFLIFYFAFFLSFSLFYPEFIELWNFSTLTGILIAGVPLEELLFAFTFGMLWSSYYEHLRWIKLKSRPG